MIECIREHGVLLRARTRCVAVRIEGNERYIYAIDACLAALVNYLSSKNREQVGDGKQTGRFLEALRPLFAFSFIIILAELSFTPESNIFSLCFQSLGRRPAWLPLSPMLPSNQEAAPRKQGRNQFSSWPGWCCFTMVSNSRSH